VVSCESKTRQQHHQPLNFSGHWSLGTALPVFARGSVYAVVGEHQALDWLAADDVGLDDFIDIGLSDLAIPNSVRINDDVRTMLTLIETAGLVGSHFAFEAAFGQLLLEKFL